MQLPMVLLFLLVLAGCEQSGSPVAPTPSPTNTPPLLLTATVAVARIDSGGLGLDIQEWENRHGKPDGIGTYGGPAYDNGLYEIDADYGPIELVWVYWGEAPRVTVTEARAVLPGLIPKDSILISNNDETDDFGRIYSEVYESASLATVIDNHPPPVRGLDRWRGTSPGTFEVRISSPNFANGIVTALNIALGKVEP